MDREVAREYITRTAHSLPFLSEHTLANGQDDKTLRKEAIAWVLTGHSSVVLSLSLSVHNACGCPKVSRDTDDTLDGIVGSPDLYVIFIPQSHASEHRGFARK